MRISRHNQQVGSALVIALFIMTLVAITATAMTLRLKLDMAKLNLAKTAGEFESQAQLPLFLGLQWLLQEPLPIQADKQNPAILKRFIGLSQQAGWRVSGAVIDLQSRYNLNNLIRIKNQLTFALLLKNTGMDISKAKKISQLAHYWTQSLKLGRGQDALLQQYLQQKPPYYPGFQTFVNPSEIRLMPGMSAVETSKILPYITALPTSFRLTFTQVPTPINILTAPPLVLKSLGAGLKDSQVERIISLRQSGKLNQKNQVSQMLSGMQIPSGQITTESEYFLILSTVEHDNRVLKLYAVAERLKQKNKKKIMVDLLSVSYHIP